MLFPGWALRSPLDASHSTRRIAARAHRGRGPAPNRRRRSRFARPYYSDTAPRRRFTTSTTGTPSATATSLPTARRWTARSTGCAAPSEGGSPTTVLVRTSDHGDLLGAHGSLHQSGFNLYDEATRVPFVIARIGERSTTARTITTPTSRRPRAKPCSVRRESTSTGWPPLAEDFTEVHPLPGRNLMPIIDGANQTPTGRSTSSPATTCSKAIPARQGFAMHAPIDSENTCPAAHFGYQRTASNFEGLVIRVSESIPAEPATSGSWSAPSTIQRPGPSPGVLPPCREQPGRRCLSNRSTR